MSIWDSHRRLFTGGFAWQVNNLAAACSLPGTFRNNFSKPVWPGLGMGCPPPSFSSHVDVTHASSLSPCGEQLEACLHTLARSREQFGVSVAIWWVSEAFCTSVPQISCHPGPMQQCAPDALENTHPPNTPSYLFLPRAHSIVRALQ